MVERSEGLHIHFAIEGEEIGTPILKNAIALYGLYEREIETWLDVSRGNQPGELVRKDRKVWCQNIRVGMERGNLHLDLGPRFSDDTYAMITTIGHKYTAQEFTSRVYNCPGWVELGTEVYGLHMSKSRIDEVSRLSVLGASGFTEY
jgi:hypothetical protein